MVARPLLLLLLTVPLCAGCLTDRDADGIITVACLGDSNTDPRLTPTDAAGTGWQIPWCDLLERQDVRLAVAGAYGLPTVLPVRFVPYANFGAMACSRPDSWVDAEAQMNNALDQHADVIIAAFGTN